jgi:RNA 3'-terminal phosphate cyclase
MSKRPRVANTQSATAPLVYKGTANFRARLVLSCLSSRPVRITEIRPDDEMPGKEMFI